MDERIIKQAVETIQLSDMQKQRLVQKCRETKKKKRPYLRALAAAACAAIVMLSGTWLWQGGDTKSLVSNESVADRNAGHSDFSENKVEYGEVQESGIINSDSIGLADRIDLDFSQTVLLSSHIVDAEYLGVENGELLFEVTNTYKGRFEDSDPIYVLPFEDGEETREDAYQIGSSYMLFLRKYSHVYWEHDYYAQTDCIHMPETDEAWEKTHEETAALLKDSKYSAEVAAVGNPFTTSLAVSDALKVAENIFVVEIDSIDGVSTVQPTTVFYATVVKTIRNQPANNGEIMLTLFNDTVEVGKEYVVLVNHSSETSKIYTVASRNSVFTVEEAEAIPELKELLANAKDY